MADNKKYLEFLDIPNGSGSTERWYSKDADAQAAIQTLQAQVDALDPAEVASVAEGQAAIAELT